jgi:hypothetical protein
MQIFKVSDTASASSSQTPRRPHTHGTGNAELCPSPAGRPSVPAPAPCGPCPCGRSKARGAPKPLAGKWVKVKPRSAGWCGRFSLECRRHSRWWWWQCQCNAWGGGPHPSRVASDSGAVDWHGSEAVDCWRGGVRVPTGLGGSHPTGGSSSTCCRARSATGAGRGAVLALRHGKAAMDGRSANLATASAARLGPSRYMTPSPSESKTTAYPPRRIEIETRE